MKEDGVSRREFIEAAALAGLAAGSAAFVPGRSSATVESGSMASDRSAGGRYNILFLLTDQERYFDPAVLPAGYRLPGRERMRREGISFDNHQIATSVCSSSRSVIYTGQHIQHTGVFDNLGFPWSNELSLETPTIGKYLEEVGYYAAYLGKCHMIEALEEVEIGNVPDVNLEALNQVMRTYGFRDYVGVGDVIGLTQGGYKSDEFTTSTAIRWLRSEPPRLDSQPWFLAVNLVNPHDVMFFDTDAPGGPPVQSQGAAMGVSGPPAHTLYQRSWDLSLPESRKEAWDRPGRPRAHYNFQTARAALVGEFPHEDERWRRLQDYYLNCIADCDRHVERILRELDDLGLADDTVVVMTSDHGELAGAHGMHGKGATAYEEQLHVPLWIRHPEHAESAGARCNAVTSHLDLAPTLLSIAGADAQKRASLAPKLVGHDLGRLLASPAEAKADAVREGALYGFNMWLYQDPDFLHQMIAAQRRGEDPAKLGLRVDLAQRGAIRSITDGRYRFSRYFSPQQHNRPDSLEALYRFNDVELFDRASDPHEIENLAIDRRANGELLLAMNEKLNDLIAEEVGEDDGSFLPENERGWAVTTFDP